MKTLTSNLADRIVELITLADNPAAFCRSRHEILDEFMASFTPDEQERMRQLQEQIDYSNALVGNPSLAVKQLTGMIDDRAKAIDEMKRALGDSLQIEPRV